MLRKLIALAAASGLAKKAWDHYQAAQPQRPQAAPRANEEPAHQAGTERDKPSSRAGRKAGGRRKKKDTPSS